MTDPRIEAVARVLARQAGISIGAALHFSRGTRYSKEDIDTYEGTNWRWHTDTARAAIEAADKAAWRPIDEAPKDGTRFLAYQPREESRYYECWWLDDFANWSGWQDDWDNEPDPTHFMPLPTPPESGDD